MPGQHKSEPEVCAKYVSIVGAQAINTTVLQHCTDALLHDQHFTA